MYGRVTSATATSRSARLPVLKNIIADARDLAVAVAEVAVSYTALVVNSDTRSVGLGQYCLPKVFNG